MSEQPSFIQVSSWQRFAVIVLYIVATIGVFWGVAEILTSKSCHADSGCGNTDQIIYAGISVLWFIFAFVWAVLGIKGLLPGARRKMVKIDWGKM